MSWVEFFSAVSIGLLASAHCLAMCGGISAALGISTAADRNLLLVLFSAGRIVCYALLGILIANVSTVLTLSGSTAAFASLRLLAGLMLLAIGLYIGGWWQGLQKMESLGQVIWQKLSPLSRSLLPVRNPLQALGLGALWGFLPCGLIYSTLIWAGAQSHSPVGAGLLMLGFGLGTLPAMLLAGQSGKRMQQQLAKRSTRHIAGVLLLLFAVWTLLGAVHLLLSGHGGHMGH